MKIAYRTKHGVIYHSNIEKFTSSSKSQKYLKCVDLIFTSPPFPLNRKKRYGNATGQEYLNWITSIFKSLLPFLRDSGSIVVEIGNSWEKGSPQMSTLPIETLLSIKNTLNLKLCQTFIWDNPAKLPSPAQWVNIDRIRVKDAFTYLWWLSLDERPKANNRNVLREYSKRMMGLLNSGKYNSGKRPSEHVIGEQSFKKNNQGSIPSNVLTLPNTDSNSPYIKYCRENKIELHPARMPSELAEFFIKFLTDPGDLVMDPFAGSNTTGEVSEKLDRTWLAIEANLSYIEGSKGRFIFRDAETNSPKFSRL